MCFATHTCKWVLTSVHSLWYFCCYFLSWCIPLLPPAPPPLVCGVSNNYVFSSFTESMTHAHHHYWIYGGSQLGLGMLIRRETSIGTRGAHDIKEEKAAWSSNGVSPAHPHPPCPALLPHSNHQHASPLIHTGWQNNAALSNLNCINIWQCIWGHGTNKSSSVWLNTNSLLTPVQILATSPTLSI